MKYERILCAGSFDGLHLGHVEYFKQAKRLGKKVIVVVSSDENYMKRKGFPPLHSQDERMKVLAQIKLIDEVVKGSKGNILDVVKKISPDAILLGYDDHNKEEELKSKLKEAGLEIEIIRAEPYEEKRLKSSLVKEIWKKT